MSHMPALSSVRRAQGGSRLLPSLGTHTRNVRKVGFLDSSDIIVRQLMRRVKKLPQSRRPSIEGYCCRAKLLFTGKGRRANGSPVAQVGAVYSRSHLFPRVRIYEFHLDAHLTDINRVIQTSPILVRRHRPANV